MNLKTFYQVKEATHKGPHIVQFHLFGNFQNNQYYKDRRWISGCHLWEHGGLGIWLLKGMQFLFGRLNAPKLMGCDGFNNSVNIPKNIELYTLSGWIVWYVNDTLRNLFPHQNPCFSNTYIPHLAFIIQYIDLQLLFFFSWSNVASHPQNSGNDFWIVGFIPIGFLHYIFQDFFPNGCILLLHMKNRLLRNEIPLWIHLMLVQSLTHSRCLAMTCKYYW